MDRPNLFMEDTDFNICLSWLCGSTDGATWSLRRHFEKKMKPPAGMGEGEFFNETYDFFEWERWQYAIGRKHNYKVDDPRARDEAERMVKDLNALIDRVNREPNYLEWAD